MKNTLKALCMMMAVALTFGMTSCSDDYEDLIIGKWNVESMTETISGHPDASENGTFTETIPAGFTYTMTFNKDKSGEVYMSYGGMTESESFTWSIDDDNLYMTQDGETDCAIISKLDKKELILSGSEKDQDYYEDETGELVPCEYTVSYSIKMKKA